MKIEFGVFLKIRRENEQDLPEELASPASTTASQLDLAEPGCIDTSVGFAAVRA